VLRIRLENGSSNNKHSLKKRKKECAWAVMAIFKEIESISAANRVGYECGRIFPITYWL
jgi:hypothetical protein